MKTKLSNKRYGKESHLNGMRKVNGKDCRRAAKRHGREKTGFDILAHGAVDLLFEDNEKKANSKLSIAMQMR